MPLIGIATGPYKVLEIKFKATTYLAKVFSFFTVYQSRWYNFIFQLESIYIDL